MINSFQHENQSNWVQLPAVHLQFLLAFFSQTRYLRNPKKKAFNDEKRRSYCTHKSSDVLLSTESQALHVHFNPQKEGSIKSG
jgi:hypothetical protein